MWTNVCIGGRISLSVRIRPPLPRAVSPKLPLSQFPVWEVPFSGRGKGFVFVFVLSSNIFAFAVSAFCRSTSLHIISGFTRWTMAVISPSLVERRNTIIHHIAVVQDRCSTGSVVVSHTTLKS